ncbi:MAG: dioxygenase [Pigmentiphaga sp.]
MPALLPTTPDSLLPLVVKAMSRTPDPRLSQLMASLTTHLHRFVLDNQVTESEFEAAVDFLIGIGQATNDTKNEVILAADLLGVSTLVALLNNQDPHGHGTTQSALLGPFWRANSPVCEAGDNIARSPTGGTPLEIRGRVLDHNGRPLAGAVVDVWQSDPRGLYENQDPQQENMNLRGRFTTNDEGEYFVRTIQPAGYPVPTDGPCGDLLRAQDRHPYRPAHVHFMVSHPDYKVLVTQVFPSDAEHLESDPTFGVTASLVGEFRHENQNGQPINTLQADFRLIPGPTVFPHPPIP